MPVQLIHVAIAQHIWFCRSLKDSSQPLTACSHSRCKVHSTCISSLHPVIFSVALLVSPGTREIQNHSLDNYSIVTSRHLYRQSIWRPHHRTVYRTVRSLTFSSLENSPSRASLLLPSLVCNLSYYFWSSSSTDDYKIPRNGLCCSRTTTNYLSDHLTLLPFPLGSVL